jgi:hypothetical protein
MAADVRDRSLYRDVFRHVADDPPYPRQIVRYGGWF